MQLGMHGSESNVGLPNAAEVASGSPVHSYFKREVGQLARAYLRWGHCSKLPRPTSQAALNGTRYEKKVLALLSRTFGDRILPGPVFTFEEAARYSDFDRKSKAIPDALIFDWASRSVLVVEVKLRHTGDAWCQLNKFYLPIVRKALPWARVCALEICSQYDPSQRLPQATAFVETAEAAFEIREAFHPVFILTSRELRNDRGMG